jgi:hypothetical protein
MQYDIRRKAEDTCVDVAYRRKLVRAMIGRTRRKRAAAFPAKVVGVVITSKVIPQYDRVTRLRMWRSFTGVPLCRRGSCDACPRSLSSQKSRDSPQRLIWRMIRVINVTNSKRVEISFLCHGGQMKIIAGLSSASGLVLSLTRNHLPLTLLRLVYTLLLCAQHKSLTGLSIPFSLVKTT